VGLSPSRSECCAYSLMSSYLPSAMALPLCCVDVSREAGGRRRDVSEPHSTVRLGPLPVSGEKFSDTLACCSKSKLLLVICCLPLLKGMSDREATYMPPPRVVDGRTSRSAVVFTTTLCDWAQSNNVVERRIVGAKLILHVGRRR
jgi:hypothetical protein